MVEPGGEEDASVEIGGQNRVPWVKVGQKNSASSLVVSEYRYSRWNQVGKKLPVQRWDGRIGCLR